MGRWMEDSDGREVCRDCGSTPVDCRCAEDAELEAEHRTQLAVAVELQHDDVRISADLLQPFADRFDAAMLDAEERHLLTTAPTYARYRRALDEFRARAQRQWPAAPVVVVLHEPDERLAAGPVEFILGEPDVET